MKPEERRYVRVYYSIVNDERFTDVYHDARVLGTWLQLLLVADGMYPADAPLPAYVHRPSVRVLEAAGLIETGPHQHFRIHGLASEREMRARAGRNAAVMRWHSVRNADPMPRRDEETDKETDDAREDDDGRRDLEAWLLVKRHIPTPRQRAFLDVYQRVFDRTGPERAERLILAHPDDPIAALKEDLDSFRSERLEEAKVAEQKPSPPRRSAGMPTATKELLAYWAAEKVES